MFEQKELILGPQLIYNHTYDSILSFGKQGSYCS